MTGRISAELRQQDPDFAPSKREAWKKQTETTYKNDWNFVLAINCCQLIS